MVRRAKLSAMTSINHESSVGLTENISRKQIQVDSSRQTNISKILERKKKVSREIKSKCRIFDFLEIFWAVGAVKLCKLIQLKVVENLRPQQVENPRKLQ